MMMRFGVLLLSAGLSSACDPASLQTQINQIETVCCAGQDCTTVRVERHGVALSIACLPLVAASFAPTAAPCRLLGLRRGIQGE